MTRSSHGDVPAGRTLYTFSRANEAGAPIAWCASDEEARAYAIEIGAHKALNEVTGEVVFHNETYC